MREAVEPCASDFFHQRIQAEGLLFLRDQHRRCADGKAHIHGKMAGVAAHDLHHGAALVGLHGIAQLVDALDGGICRGIVADAVVGAADVVINGCGHAHHGDPVAGQGQRAAEGAVAADGDDAVKAQQLAGGHRLALAFLCAEFLASGGIEHGTAAGDDVRNAVLLQPDDIAADQAVPAAPDTDALDPAVIGAADNSTDRCIHAGSVAAGGQHADSFYCICHNQISFYVII